MIEEKKWEPLGRKHNWTTFGRKDFLFKLIIKDKQTEQTLDKFSWDTTENYKKILEILRLKYNLEYRERS